MVERLCNLQETIKPASHVLQFPNELLLDIFYYLNETDLLNCAAVCKDWRNIATDVSLWRYKLQTIFYEQWFTVMCDTKPVKFPDFSNVNTLHPLDIYRFLFNYVTPTAPGPPQLGQGPLTRSTSKPFASTISNWWNHLTQKLSLGNFNRSRYHPVQQHRFAVFGPGLDHRHTTYLFKMLFDVQTKSFKSIHMLPGRMGFGAGLTLCLYSEAQKAVFDPSLNLTLPNGDKRNNSDSIETGSDTNPTTSTQSLVPSTSMKQSNAINSTKYRVNTMEATNPFGDFTFDLHYLYSVRGQLGTPYAEQSDRLLQSRLFEHALDMKSESITDALRSLRVTGSMRYILNTINGLLYAIDATESATQIAPLRHELNAVLRGFPEHMSNKVPIAILYIMPKEDIPKFTAFPRPRSGASSNSTHSAIVNRDSYSGEKLTAAWHGSILLPVSQLRLFELENPWRLQRCASNDLKAVIQSLMWLHSRAPLLSIQALPIDGGGTSHLRSNFTA